MDKEEAKKQVQIILERYNKIIQENRINKYNEETTKKDLILPLFRALGWNTEDSLEVSAEEKVSKKRVDYGFRINGISKFFLEAKALGEDLLGYRMEGNTKITYVEQAINYAYNKGCTWAVLTNFKEIKIFNAEWKSNNILQNHFKTLSCHEFLDKFDDLWLLSKEAFEQGLLDKLAESWGKKAKKAPIGEQLLSDFTHFREIISKNINKLNSGKNLSELEIDEATQRILDRLIFIRSCEDRELEEKTLLPNLRQWESKGRGQLIKSLREVFAYYDGRYNSKIFHEHLCDSVEIDNEVLSEVIEGLYYTKDKQIYYDFSAIEADVLGNIYEQYLGYILKKTPRRAKLSENHAHRKEQGIYYTPTYIVKYIIENTIKEYCKDKTLEQISEIRILDPACGSGSFLIKAFDVLAEIIKERIKNGEKYDIFTELREDGELWLGQKIRIVSKNIYGVDLDPKAVEIAQLSLLLKLLENEGRDNKGGRILPVIQNIKNGNSLIDDPAVAGENAFKWEEQFPEAMQEGGFDIVIGNPPYVRIQTLNKEEVNFFNNKYKSAIKNYDIYMLFVEKGLSLLKEGGILGFILPSKFFNADYGEGLRKLINEKNALYKIIDFKDFQIFEGATTYTCLLFLKKSKKDNFDYFEIKDKKKLEDTKILTEDIFKKSVQKQPKSGEPWIFVSDDSKKIMKKLNDIKLKLKDISKEIFVGLQTSSDKLYFVNLIEEKGDYAKIKNNYDKREYLIEKEILKKLLKGKEIRRWGVDWQKIYIIYPYLVKNNNARLIPLEEIKSKYPKTYQYFLAYEKELKGRENNRFKNDKNWHQFGRLQNIEKFEQPKIMTQVLASKNSFTFDEKGEYYFVGGGNAGGYGIVLKEEYFHEYYWVLSLLNSKVLEFYLKKISTPFRGGFYSYGKRFIEQLPIKLPSENEKRILSEFTKKQLERSKRLNEIGEKKTDERARIEEEIKKTDAEIDELVYKIYGITEEEKKIIEESVK